MTTQNVDFLIVGQGLAGSVLSQHLQAAGATVHVLNAETQRPSASGAAAGLYNPITGRKLVKTWRADELFPYLTAFYPQLEAQLSASFFHPLSIYRPFFDTEQQNEWATLGDDQQYVPYVQQVLTRSHYGAWVDDDRGGLLLKQCGYLNVPALLAAYRNHLRAQHQYTEAVFDAHRLNIFANYVTYDGGRAQKIIFCDGTSGAQSHFFGWLPFRPVKGEILRIKTADVMPVVFNRGVFVIPQGRYANVGSTYDHHDLSDAPTERGHQRIRQKLDKLLRVPYEVVDHWAGVRPATQDRLPFIGQHPEHEPLMVFNGFGSKAVSLAPYFAQHFVHCLIKNRTTDEAVNIRRFYHYYSSS